MILALLSCFWPEQPDLEIDEDGVVLRGEKLLFPFQPSAARLVYPPDMRPVQRLPFQLREDLMAEARDNYWLQIGSDTHIGWLYRVFYTVSMLAHRDSPEGPQLRVTSPFGEYLSTEWDCWVVVIDMEEGIPQIAPATAPGNLIRSSRPRRLGVDGQCVQLTSAELPGFLERVPNRCEDVILEADDLTWKEAEPWFDAFSATKLMYPKMRTVWRLREEGRTKWVPDHEPVEYTDWKCENRLDMNQLKNPGFSNRDSKTTPNWAQVW